MSVTESQVASAPRPSGEALIRLERVGRRYRVGGNEVIALADASFEVRPEEFVVVLGPSGSGKTTLLNMIGALDSPTEGRVVSRAAISRACHARRCSRSGAMV